MSLNAQADTIIILYPKEPLITEQKENDTLFINNPNDGIILYGNAVIPTTSNQVGLYSAGLWLTEMTGSECENGIYKNNEEDNINTIIITDSTMVFNINIISNCCHKFLGDASFVEDSILNLIYIGYGGNCACNCCFNLTYSFSRMESEDSMPLTHVMIDNDPKALKPIPVIRK
jgi:hypothetical protein